MYNGGGSARPHWQNANNPNMAPLHARPRPGLGAGPPPGMQQTGMPPGLGPGVGPPPGMMMEGPPPPPHGAMVGRPMMGGELQNSSAPFMGGMPAGPTPSSAGGVPAHTTLFVGNISAGVTDPWIQSLLTACGPLRSFKRVNASFGFAEYADPDSALRALAVLSGQELPALGAENQDKAIARKKLTVKADEKTRKFLDQYEQGKQKTEYDDQTETQAREGLRSILTQMSDPANLVSTQSTASYNVPSHLKDLPPEELPEEHRGSVLSEIDKFRQASAAREEEKRRRERVQELERKRNVKDTGRGAAVGTGANGRDVGDRQSYLRPVNFVGSENAEDKKTLTADQRDEREEERRKAREQDDMLRSAHDAERRYLDQERGRLAHWDRELAKEKDVEDRRERESAIQRKIYESWDQLRQAEREVFFVDRHRWKAMRRTVREREEREDESDRKAQMEDEERAKIEAERFLAQQAEDMAAFEAQQRAAGVLLAGEGSHAPLKLKVAATGASSGAAAPSSDEASRPGKVSLLGNVEDEGDLAGIRRGKLAHIDLRENPADENREEKRDRIKQELPTEAEQLFKKLPVWEQMDQTLVESRYKSLLDQGIVESIGEPVPDMVDELIGKVRTHANAKDLIAVVEEVLEEEAGPLIEKLWRELLLDTWSV